MDLDVKVKATVMGAAFLIVSIDLISYQPRTQGLISASLPRAWWVGGWVQGAEIRPWVRG